MKDAETVRKYLIVCVVGSMGGPRRSEKEDEPGKEEGQAGRTPSAMRVNFNFILWAMGRYQWML